MESRLPLGCQMSRPTFRHQVWLIMHARSLKDLTGQIFSFESPTSLGCWFCMVLLEKGILSLLLPDVMIPDMLHTCPRRPKGFELERDTWRRTSHKNKNHFFSHSTRVTLNLCFHRENWKKFKGNYFCFFKKQFFFFLFSKKEKKKTCSFFFKGKEL